MNINFKLTTWNINGVKSLKSSMKSILDDLDSDVICLQEIKSSKDAIEQRNAIVDGYNSYFSFCKAKSGYSGVSIFSRNPNVPVTAEEGLTGVIKKLNGDLSDDCSICDELNISYEDLLSLESEGRAVCCEFLIKNCPCGASNPDHSLWIINVYCPMAEMDNKERQHYKKMYNQLISLTVNSIIDRKSHVMLVGDLNVVHKSIDIAETVPKEIFLSYYHRHWFDAMLVKSQKNHELESYRSNETFITNDVLVDTFRHLHPSDTDCYSCWNTKIGGRQTNFGTRIDYILCDEAFLSQDQIVESRLLTDVYGSDHCPVTTAFNRLELVPSTQMPPLSSSNISRFRNQSKITSFIVRTQKSVKRTQPSDGDNSNGVATKIPKLSDVPAAAAAKPVQKKTTGISSQWKAIFKEQPKAPLCAHKIPSVLRTVVKDTVNKGKNFWVCSKSKGLPGHPESRCNFFQWDA